MAKKIYKGGECICGAKLPLVEMHETPYQYCSTSCKKLDQKKGRK